MDCTCVGFGRVSGVCVQWVGSQYHGTHNMIAHVGNNLHRHRWPSLKTASSPQEVRPLQRRSQLESLKNGSQPKATEQWQSLSGDLAHSTVNARCSTGQSGWSLKGPDRSYRIATHYGPTIVAGTCCSVVTRGYQKDSASSAPAEPTHSTIVLLFQTSVPNAKDRAPKGTPHVHTRQYRRRLAFTAECAHPCKMVSVPAWYVDTGLMSHHVHPVHCMRGSLKTLSTNCQLPGWQDVCKCLWPVLLASVTLGHLFFSLSAQPGNTQCQVHWQLTDRNGLAGDWQKESIVICRNTMSLCTLGGVAFSSCHALGWLQMAMGLLGEFLQEYVDLRSGHRAAGHGCTGHLPSYLVVSPV